MMLEDELLGVEGVTGAIVSIGETGPIGVQLEVADDSDRASVIASIERILDARGLNAVFPTESNESPNRSSLQVSVAASAPSSAAAGTIGGARPPRAGPQPARVLVDTVAVSESDRGIHVAVRLTNGVKRSVECPASEPAVWQAMAELLYDMGEMTGPRPLVEAVEWLVVGEVESVVVVLAEGRHRRLGAAPNMATRPLTVGRAIWAALA